MLLSTQVNKGVSVIIITASEFKAKIGRYLSLASKEDIIITRNGKRIARLTGENEDLVSTAKSLFGILPGDATVEEAREEKMQRYERNDWY